MGKRTWYGLGATLLGAAVVVFFFVAPAWVERARNGVRRPPPYQVSARAEALHRRLRIADLHADSLLWGRDLARWGMRGHVDLPRLASANVAVQAFTIVTKSPRDFNIESNSDETDNIAPLAIAQRWPLRSWTSLTERALYQARRLRQLAARSNGAFRLIRSRGELASYLAERQSHPQLTAGFLGVEGAHALEGSLTNVDRLFDAGVRMMSPTHFFDNAIGGSAHGLRKGGLTALGRVMIRRMEERHMLVDLAHASRATIRDVLAIATRPVVVSHTGVRGTCDNRRNLSDDQIRGIAKPGGVVAIGFWKTAVCGTDARAIVRAIRHVAKLVSVEHVALGSDFDGSVDTPFDVTGLPRITEALIDAGFSERDIEKIMGDNTLRVLQQTFP